MVGAPFRPTGVHLSDFFLRFLQSGENSAFKELAWLGQAHLYNLLFTILGDIITGVVYHQIQVLFKNFVYQNTQWIYFQETYLLPQQ